MAQDSSPRQGLARLPCGSCAPPRWHWPGRGEGSRHAS